MAQYNGLVHACIFLHSPSNYTETKCTCKMLDFGRWECLCKYVSDHVHSGTIYKSNLTFFNNPTDEMIAQINMLGARTILMISSKCNGRLVVREEGGGVELGEKSEK